MAYNGWANQETWNAYNWLTVDESTTRHCEALAARGDDASTADALREVFAQDVDAMAPGWARDVLTWAVDAVNWRELAQAFR